MEEIDVEKHYGNPSFSKVKFITYKFQANKLKLSLLQLVIQLSSPLDYSMVESLRSFLE